MAWLGALLIALLVAAIAPALARADEGSAGGAAVAERPAGTQAPPAQEPAGADEGAVVTEEPAAAPVDEEPVAPPADGGAVEAPVAPEPPAATPVDDRGPIELPGLAELAPAEAPSPAGEAAAALAPAVAELVPVLGAPSAPRGAALAAPPPEPPKAVVTAPPPAPAAAAQDAAPALTTGTLGGPPVVRGAGPVVEASREALEGAGVLAAAAVPLRGAFVTLDPARVVVPAVAEARGGPATPAREAFAAAEAEFPAPQVVAPDGPAPSQSLLAVLAAYILPGSGPVPASTLLMLVLVGLILAAVFAPRPGGAERIWLSGLVGPRVGHGLAVRRPG